MDDVEVVNPIGAARGKHKLCLIYVQCLNPPPHIRNRVQNVWLATVALRKDVDAVGMNIVLNGGVSGQPASSIGEAMQRCHAPAGVALDVQRPGTSQYEVKHFRGWVVLLAADALAWAEFIGSKRSFGPRIAHPCCFCNATREGMRYPGTINDAQCPWTERTPAIYDAQSAFAATRPAVQPPQQLRRGISKKKTPAACLLVNMVHRASAPGRSIFLLLGLRPLTRL